MTRYAAVLSVKHKEDGMGDAVVVVVVLVFRVSGELLSVAKDTEGLGKFRL